MSGSAIVACSPRMCAALQEQGAAAGRLMPLRSAVDGRLAGRAVRFTGAGQHTAMPVTLAADTMHTIVVLDDSLGLKVDAVTDAASSQIMPKGAVSAGSAGPHHARR